jgi:putative transposase
MARRNRVLAHNARYHVSVTINRKEMVFKDKATRTMFYKVIAQAKDRYAFYIENFILMGNHVHLIIRPYRDDNLSRIMQWILSVFAMRYNKTMGYTGHVWGQRFFSRIIAGFMDFLKTFVYIDENPVRAGLVEDACDWEDGGLHHSRIGRHDVVDAIDWISLLFPSHSIQRLGS